MTHYTPEHAFGLDDPDVDRVDWLEGLELSLIRAGRRGGLRPADAETLADRAIGIAKREPDEELEKVARSTVRRYLKVRSRIASSLRRAVAESLPER